MDRYVTLEELNGEGRLVHENGDVAIGAVTYDVMITQRIHEVRSHDGTGEIPGLKSMTGRIFASVSPSFIGKPMILELEDGRRWACFFQPSSIRRPDGG